MTTAGPGARVVEQQEPISIAEARSVLDRALLAIIRGDLRAIELFTEDVVYESPNTSARSRDELVNQLIDRAGAVSNIEFTIDEVERAHTGFTVAWRLSGDHTGEVLLNDDEFFEPSGLRLELSARTDIQFRGSRICAFHTIYVGPDPFDQMRGRGKR